MQFRLLKIKLQNIYDTLRFCKEMSGEVKAPYFTMGSITLLVLMFFVPNQMTYGQTKELLSSTIHQETIKIVDPITTQNVSTGQELSISGLSSDNSLKDCSVSLIVNDVKPYQNADASGTEGTADFSQWKFVLRTNYTQIIDGENKITAKLLCSSAPTRWYSVFVNGVPNSDNKEIVSPVQSQPPQELAPVQAQPPQELPLANVSDIGDIDSNNNIMLVSVFPQKNPVARGDTQNTTITVTDSNSIAIPNADIDGKLVYPGGDFEKTFNGQTDLQGKFVYSWTIGENGDLGPLSVEIDVSSQGRADSSVTSSFDIVDSSSTSGINSVSGESVVNGKSEFDFVIAGDYGCDSKTRQTIEGMEDEDPDLVFALGDLSEVKDSNCFFDIISDLDEDGRFKVALGDDDTTSTRYGDYINHFDLENPFYSFDYQNVHFLAMSTGKGSVIPYVNGSEQYQFIQDDLIKAANNPNIDWIIVYGYRPFYTSPSIHPANEILRETYPPLFEKYGVDMVITSHNHNYQRSYPLVYNIDSSRQPIVKDVNASQYNSPGVPIYFIVGTAGNNLYDFRGQAPYMVSQFQETGFLHVNVTKTDRDVLAGGFLNIETGNYVDQFMIIKSEFE
ncbi:MAG TPA: metallophosphoesterase [Nitrososphaeraceae archaeon]|nr:metallophosphoesterase [Nitrososphaeraceae archaeon]